MGPFDEIKQYQQHQIEKAERRLREVELLEDLAEEDVGPDVELTKKHNEAGKYELIIETDELYNEVVDTLNFGIVQKTEINKSGDGVIITGKVDFSPLTVNQYIVNETRRNRKENYQP